MSEPLRAVPQPAIADNDSASADAAALDRRRNYMAGPAALLGGPANVIMQLGFAPVGRGVIESTVDSGRFDLRPRKRGRTTLTYLAVAMLGTDEDRAAYKEAVDSVHRFVRTQSHSPVKYNAFDPTLQLWVAACLYKGWADAINFLYGSIPDEDADAIYRDAARFGTTLQVPEDMWPADRAAFETYWKSKVADVQFDDEVKGYLLDQVVDLGPYRRIEQVLGRPANRFFTTGFLPQRFRDELGLEWSPRRQRLFELTLRLIGVVFAELPERFRAYPFEGFLVDMRKRRALGKPLV